MIAAFVVANAARTKTKSMTRRELESLRMCMDWQLRAAGYCPDSVAGAFREADSADQLVALARTFADPSDEEKAAHDAAAELMDRERAGLCARLGR